MPTQSLRCPKCGKENSLPGGGVANVTCAACGHGFAIPPPRKANIPPPPPTITTGGAASTLPSLRDQERPLLNISAIRGRSNSDLPAARSPTPAAPWLDLPAPSEQRPRQNVGEPIDLPMHLMSGGGPPPVPPRAPPPPPPGFGPAAVAAQPGASSDLPAPRESVPLTNLPAARESVPLTNLPAARESVPLTNLPAARESVPLTNLPAARESVPLTNLPGDRSAISGVNLPGARESVAKPTNLPATRSQVNIPGQQRPGAVALGRVGTTPNPEVLPRDLLGQSTSPLAPLDLGLDLGGGLDLDLPPAASPSGATIFGVPPSPQVPGDERALGNQGESDLGFTLNIEGAEWAPPESNVAAVKPQSVLPAIELQGMGTADAALPRLAPHAIEEKAKEEVHKRRRSRAPLIAAFVLAVGGGAGAYYFFMLRGPAAESIDVLGPHKPAIDKDLFSAYEVGAQDLLKAAATKRPDADTVRAGAAELLLLAYLGREGPKTLLPQAENALAEILETPNPPAVERRARALAAIARKKTHRVDALLVGLDKFPDAMLVIALRHLNDGQPIKVAQVMQAFVKMVPQSMLGWYLLARSLEAIGEKDQARQHYARVLRSNPDHLGAALGELRLSDGDTATRRDKATPLLEKRKDFSSPGERAAVLVFIGQAGMELGRTADATRAFTEALTVDPTNVEANVALGETYLREGKFADAVARFQVAAPLAPENPGVKFGLGGSFIATRRLADGMTIIEDAASKWPNDPRGPFFRGWAAEEGGETNVAPAIKFYQEALGKSPTFVPASLRLASLLQRTGRADDALKVLKGAEEAGAPPMVLQIAWGEALIIAKQPQRAEEVFRKALATDAKLGSARMGLASALEAQGRVGEAKLSLDEMLTEDPNTDGLRERLAALCLRLGEKEEALRHYQAEVESGKASNTVKVALAQVAIDMGNFALAEKHLTKVSDDSPGTPGALYNLGRLFELQGNLARALQEYRRATQFENTPAVQLAFGKALLKGGREDDALVALRAAEVLAEARLEHGRLMLKRNEVERAITDLTAAVAIDPRLDEASLLIGNAYDHMGDGDRAAKAWAEAINIAPRNVEARYRLGRLLMDRGKPKDALEHLRKAAAEPLDKKVWAPELFFQLGYAELNTGSKKSAKVALQRYLELAPTDAPARPAIEKLIDDLSR